ncbi:MAG TPA: alcohol dehydrogenase catalytic domain-containing protein [Thermoanaerobaculia bacterium]|jgi:threonine dehydrogenase-like Zn-dependent dehydrogenase|nr:alcohol dehydrogenase catalytic domain-containing protein [Thermoanaerobaculia bacterium]
MRSAVLLEPRRFDVRSMEPPAPGEGEVLLKVRGCGVCGSDMGPWKGIQGLEYPMNPGAPGHEVFGTVEAVGSGVEGLAAGDAVTALSYRAYAEYDLARVDDVVPLPSSLAGRVVLGEPLACAVNVSRRAGVAEGDVVVLLGTGFLGALILQLLRAPGAPAPRRVITVSRRRLSSEMADRLGVDESLTYEDDVHNRVGAVTGGGDNMADVVIEATGKQRPLDLGAELTRVRGRLIVAGYHQDGPRTVNMQLWNWRGIDVINAHERDPRIYKRGMEEGVRLLAEGGLDLAPLITHTFPLAEINRAFQTAEERPEGFLKSVVLPEAGS